MHISALPEWLLTPVRKVDPQQEGSFPALLTPGQDVDLCRWLDRHRAQLDDVLLRSGAVLLRGFSLDSEQAFERAAAGLTEALERSYGDLVKRSTAEFVYDATRYPNDRAILFHNEGSHTARLPRRQLFYCGRDGFTGGETPILDCRALLAAMRPELRDAFEARGLLYVRNFIRGVDVSWQDFFRTRERGEVERRCRAEGMAWTWKRDGSLRIEARVPAVIRHPVTGDQSFCNQVMLHHVACLDAKTGGALRALFAAQDLPRNVCFGDGTPISDEVMAELLTLSVQIAVRFTWQRGDLLLLDNLRVAHARCPYEGERQILVAVGDLMNREPHRGTA